MIQQPENPGLEDLLAEPIVQMAMRADGVAPQTLKSLMKDMARRIAVRRAGFLLANPAGFRRAALPRPVRPETPPFLGEFGMPMGFGEPCDMAPCW
jgi:hypothetical protein